MRKIISIIILLLFTAININAKTITVTSSADTGTGTLRQAITGANNGDIIVFDNNITSIHFAGIITIDKNITISGNETNNTVCQNAAIWTDTRPQRKRYFEILANAEVTFNHLTLQDNKSNCSGGAITNYSKLTLNNCTFSNNRALDYGGAIYTMPGSTLKVNNCIFTKNYAPSSGGAIMNNGDLSINNAVFSENYGNNAGAIYTSNTCVIENCIFSNNSAVYDSAISNYSDLQVINSIFRENKSTENATIDNNKNTTIKNTLFIQNKVADSLNPERGIITNSLSYTVSATTIINSTIVNNYGGHGIYISRNNSLSIYNSIIFNNAKNDIHHLLGNLVLQNSLIGTSNIDLTGNNNIIGEDPLFAGYDDYSLQKNSPAIDKGNNVHIAGITTDLLGNQRISNGTVDIGAHEYQANTSAIPPTSATALKIYPQHHNIIIENTTETIQVYNIAGQCVAQGTGAGSYNVSQAGIYIVRVGSEARKVIVP
ncbi:MAG: T9SS type A sorting domain-containing protein [Prevotellaceae bacterium]|jgi:predicted outer membrane repeat protein|nr:T9SS type A sorting domain-containing protein [Prevotellaceae bacterium]